MKSVAFGYTASHELSSLIDTFREMCSDAIDIALQKKPRNKFNLIELAYERLKEYGLHTHYTLSACELAFSAYRNKRCKSKPLIRRPFLKLDSQTYRLNHLFLRIPTTPRNYIFLTLQGSNHHLSFVDDPSLKKGSATVTERSVNIAFSKQVELSEPLGSLGMDTNERNATVSATDGWYQRFDEFGEVVELKERYRKIRADIARNTRGDKRTAETLLAKYGIREKNRTMSRIHRVTSQIVGYATQHRLSIKMERLKGIRKLYRRGNGQSRSFRGRMNTWVFGETQRQIVYKAKWAGTPTYFVDPRGTSSHCLCGSRVVPLVGRKLYCPKCDRAWDRDDLASKCIMACAVPQGRPSRGSDEGERGDYGSNPQSR